MDIITSRSIHRRTSAGALRICSELNVIPIMVSSPAKILVAPFRDANIDRDQSTWVHGAAGCRFEHCAAASVGLARDPSVAGFLIFMFHRRPGDAMCSAFALYRAASRVLRPGAVEGTPIDLLRMQRQMCLDRRRKVFDRPVRQATSLRVRSRA